MVIAIKFADKYIGNLMCNFLGLFNKKKDIMNVNKISVDLSYSKGYFQI